jgi:hypothetical protein
MATVKSVPIKSLKVAPWNPPKRIKNLGNLSRSIEEVGLLYPILITEKNEIVDGHRRLAVLREMGATDVKVLPVVGDQAKLFAEVNSTGHSISGNDAIQIYMVQPEALTQHMRTRISQCETIVGRAILARMAKEGMSLTSWYMAMKIHDEADMDDEELLRDTMKWLLRYRCYRQTKQALAQGTEPSRIIAAIRHGKPLRVRITVG